ncbi:hypothetical protein ES332_A10G135400v1 [Gossypium tomentosum]|uniref:Uncharacterized protein n=1 Tax=Gossypium tomentosum TaxID=34277 RepID=A0A5D2NSQ8_GOSTO|nr:hypothetical protein ES332_A10G135400v1 [Gossypium tomentosum]
MVVHCLQVHQNLSYIPFSTLRLKSTVSRYHTHVCTCTPTSTSFASLCLGIFPTGSNVYVLTCINTVKGIIFAQFATF